MSDMLNALREGLREKKAQYQDIIHRITPLEQKRKLLEERIKAIEHLISLEEGEAKPIIDIELEEGLTEGGIESEDETLTASLIGKSPKSAYKELAKTYFKDKSFREKDIRERANKEGLRVKGKLIASSYSRSLLIELRKEGFLEKLDRGLFRAKQQDQGAITRRALEL